MRTFLTDSRRAAPPRAVGLPGGAPRSARKLAARTPPVQPTRHDESGPELIPEPPLPTADLHCPDRPAPHRPPIVRPSPAHVKGAYASLRDGCATLDPDLRQPSFAPLSVHDLELPKPLKWSPMLSAFDAQRPTNRATHYTARQPVTLGQRHLITFRQPHRTRTHLPHRYGPSSFTLKRLPARSRPGQRCRRSPPSRVLTRTSRDG